MAPKTQPKDFFATIERFSFSTSKRTRNQQFYHVDSNVQTTRIAFDRSYTVLKFGEIKGEC